MKTEKLLIIANWKLNKTRSEIEAWLTEFTDLLAYWLTDSPAHQPTDLPEIALAPAFPYLRAILNPSGLEPFYKAAAQDVSQFLHGGAYTGEVSAKQLKDTGVKYIIVGHSERRQHLGETNADVNEKVTRCLENDLIPIICVSNLDEVEALTPNLQHLTFNNQQLTIAFEPIEAIGTGQPETPENAQKIALAIKDRLGDNTQVLYGGSVDASNVTDYTELPEIDGVLVSGASLDAADFAELVEKVA